MKLLKTSYPVNFLFSIAVSFILLNSGIINGMQLFPESLNLNKDKNSLHNLKIIRDTADGKIDKSKSQKIKFGGVFISPSLGVSFPFGTFNDYSTSEFIYGFKAEIAYNKLYPFVFGILYENQDDPGNAEFTTTNILNKYNTKITSFGGSLDIILNKFFKSNFTSPILTLEVKYSSVVKEIEPVTNDPAIPGDKNLLTYSAGIGFTIYVLDLVSKYTFAEEYSNLNFQARFHIPLFKF